MTSTRPGRPRSLDPRLRLGLGALIALLLVAGGALVARASAPIAVAGAPELATQRASAERSIDSVYKTGMQQLKTTRGLRLAITDAQAATIEQKYATQLKDLRHSALQALADAFALPADQTPAYIQQAETRLDGQPAQSAPPVMLAPRLYQIVQRMADLGSQLSDAGVREMTSPAPTGSPIPSPSATARPSASPSPSR